MVAEIAHTATNAAAASIVAATYARVSTRMQGQYGFSLRGQDQTLEEWVAAQGWILPERLRFRDGEDADASGTRWDLPDLNRMLEAAGRGEFQVLAVPDLDRFARTLVKGLVLEEQLKKNGVRVVYQRVPIDDSPEGRMLKNQLFSFAEYEREKMLLRTLKGRRDKALAGKVVGTGSPPYGYRYTRETLPSGKRRVCGLEPDPTTAPIARDILRALRFRSTVDLMVDLNERGVPGPGGGRWNTKVLHRMARNPVYRGTWLYGWRSGHAEPVAVAIEQPLLTPAEWDDLQRALDGRRRHRSGRRDAARDPWTLRSRLRCAGCHGAIRTKTNNGIRYYGCERHMPSAARRMDKPVCLLPDIHAADLEAELWRQLEATLFDPNYLGAALAAGVAKHQDADRLRAERLSVIDAEVAKQRKRLDALADDLADLGLESREAVRRRMKEAEELIGRLGSERADLTAVRSEGLSSDEASGIEAFAAELADMHHGLVNATPAELRALIDTLDVRGAVAVSTGGIALGRKHRFAINWTARINLSNSGAHLSSRVTT